MSLEQLLTELANAGWTLQIMGSKAAWGVTLIPRHLNYSVAPCAVRDTLEEAVRESVRLAEKQGLQP